MVSYYGWTPLYAASNRGHLEVVRLPLERELISRRRLAGSWMDSRKGGDMTAPDEDGWTTLIAVLINVHFELVKRLHEKGADVTVADNNGWTPLIAALSNGHVEVVGLLLYTVQADIDVKDDDGRTPVPKAADNG